MAFTADISTVAGDGLPDPDRELASQTLAVSSVTSILGPRPLDRGRSLPLSITQQQWWEANESRHSESAHVRVGLRFRGHLSRQALLSAINRIVARHELLRTTFHNKDGLPVQVIGCADSGLAVPDEEVFKEQAIGPISRQEDLDPFDVSTGPLIKCRLLRISEQDHVLLVTLHELIADNRSIRVFIRELGALYASFVQVGSDLLPPLKLQYADYAIWQRQQVTATVLKGQLEFWMRNLSGAPDFIQLPTDRSRPTGQLYKINRVRSEISAELTGKLRELARQQGVTLFAMLFSGWAALLGRWSGQEELVIGRRASNREYAETEALIGPFESTTALRVRLHDDPTVEHLLKQVDAAMQEASAHSDVSFDRVVEARTSLWNTSHGPVLQVQIGMNALPDSILESAELALPGVTLSIVHAFAADTRFDLSLSLDEHAQGLIGELEYASDLFERDTCERLMHRLTLMLKGMVADIEQPISRICLMTEAEREDVLAKFNDTAVAYPTGQLIHHLFEEQAALTPDSIAVVDAQQSMTYAQLNARANQLAHYLRTRNVGPDRLVALCVDRGVEMVVGLLGTLKAGGAYVPLDPSYPAERLAHMLKDSAPCVLLTQERLKQTLPPTDAELVALDSGWSDGTAGQSQAPYTSPAHSNQRPLAYVIYTSGSTGTPKGVMVEHAGVVNLLYCMRERLGISAQECVLAVTTMSFDIATFEIFLPLSVGARVVVAPQEAASNARQLIEMIEEYNVTMLQATPATWRLVSFAGWSGRKTVKALCGGEALTTDLSADLVNRVGTLWNLYGPTETTIYSCGRQISIGNIDHGSVEPIGRPIANTRAYILDRHLQPLPIGFSGEIYLGGAGVARGYLNRADLTAERFSADPFSADPQARMYRTGDVGRWRVDGTIEYLGRNDRQVKLRGVRIELAEIEAHLLRLDEVREAVVLLREEIQGQKRLVGYVVPADNQSASPTSDVDSADELVQQWQAIYDGSYGTDRRDGRPSFSVWNSSYTGTPIPAEEMREWLDCTVARIRTLNPKRVVEVGCGVGLLVEQLAPECTTYSGTDFSAVAIRQLGDWLATQELLQHVRVWQGEATDLGAIQPGSVDTVILNSVSQHFPNVEYMLTFIARAVEVVQRCGQIFIGDIRTLELLQLFHGSVQAAKASDDDTVEQVRMRARRSSERDKQLVISPEFFRRLPEHFPTITRVEIQLRRGQHHNEMSSYRYDVVLHVGKRWAVHEQAIEHIYDGPQSARQVEAALRNRKPAILRLSRVPNRRLSRDMQNLKMLNTAPPQVRMDELRAVLATQSANGEDPETFWRLGERFGYVVTVSWSHGSDLGTFDVQFIASTFASPTGIQPGAASVDVNQIPWHRYANDPPSVALSERLAPQLREALKSRLPSHMVPSSFVVLKSLPLTPNGKVDRGALLARR